MGFEANDLMAVVFQHEIDHLDGVLFVDKISMQERALVEPSLKALASRNKKQKAPA
jgi:peptide deformylase